MKRWQVSISIRISHAVKYFGNNLIIPDLSLFVRKGEFFTLLGPSGCGKTTLLRMIAGFNTIEGGDFFFNETRINDLPPNRRKIGMVFQNYAIFPNMSVEKNVAFGLTNQKIDKQALREETSRFLELVQMTRYRDRMPDKLSGGQQQRVALARALIINPDVLLMDEPLSNLDAKLRIEMRSVIKNIQRKTGITTLYVTHDQEEAMAVSDRIAVMNEGRIQQIATPRSVYQRPANLFVATFIGRTNILDAELVCDAGAPRLVFADGTGFEIDLLQKECQQNQKVKVSVRPEEWEVDPEPGAAIEGLVRESIFLGLNTHYLVETPDGAQIDVTLEAGADKSYQEGQTIRLAPKMDRINLYKEDGSRNLLTGVENDIEETSSQE